MVLPRRNVIRFLVMALIVPPSNFEPTMKRRPMIMTQFAPPAPE